MLDRVNKSARARFRAFVPHFHSGHLGMVHRRLVLDGTARIALFSEGRRRQGEKQSRILPSSRSQTISRNSPSHRNVRLPENAASPKNVERVLEAESFGKRRSEDSEFGRGRFIFGEMDVEGRLTDLCHRHPCNLPEMESQPVEAAWGKRQGSSYTAGFMQAA